MTVSERLEKYKTEVLNLRAFPSEDWVLDLFRFQAENNPLYHQYINLVGVDYREVKSVNSIPFLPIELFKAHEIKTGQWEEELYFSSSGTGSSGFSKHALYSGEFYKTHSQNCFEHFYGPLKDYCVLGLLPSYLERKGSSLVYMCEHFIEQSESEYSGFYLDKTDKLKSVLDVLSKKREKVLLIGVSFALWDFSELYTADFEDVVFMETGGMKGRRREIPREELHNIIAGAFNLPSVHSEYGMTELFSQAYSKGQGLFDLPATMKFLLRDITDPFSSAKEGKTGGLNIIDLANFSTISFIETGDLAQETKGAYKILGRLDNAMVRGCNLMYAEV